MSTVLLFLTFGLACQDDAARPAQDLIQQLRSEKIDEREGAARKLTELGTSAMPALRLAARDRDPEVAGRARDILDVLESHIDFAQESLRRVLDEERSSFQRLLWRSYHWADRACVDKDWNVVWRSLCRQKAQATDVWERDSGTTYRVVLIKGAYTFGDIAHDLFIDVEVAREIGADQPTRAHVRWIEAGLIGRPGMTTQEYAHRNPYPQDTVLARALAARSGAELPFLSEIRVTYSRSGDRYTGQTQSRFEVHLELVGNLALPREFAESVFTAASGLDPIRDSTGKPLEAGFVPKDSLGEGRSRQGSSGRWGFDRGLVRTDLRTERLPVSFMGHSTRILPVVYSLPDFAALPDDTEEVEFKGKFSLDDVGDHLGHLRKLKRWDGGISGDRGLLLLAALPELEHLSLSIKGASDRGIAQLRLLPKLRELWLYGADGITDKGMKEIGKLSTLKSLLLYSAEGITDDGLKHLDGLRELEALWLWTRANITDRGLEILGNLRSLRTLKLGDLKAITPKGLDHLAKIPDLRELIFTYTLLDDAGMEAVSRINTLEYLEVYCSPGTITDAGVSSLKPLKNLRALHLEKTKVTLDAVRDLEKVLPGKYISY